jgi:tyrosyl-tRNA synthetase
MDVYARLVTSWTPEQIDTFKRALESGELHPKDAKMKLAREIVTIYHGEAAAGEAERGFVQVFQNQGTPDDLEEYQLEEGQTVLDVLDQSGLVESRSQARRMIKQNAVRLNDHKLTDPHQEFPGKGVLQVGKRRFIRVI